MDVTVHHVELSTDGDRTMYVATCEYAHDDGTTDLGPVIVPIDAFETRAAEYDIDPATKSGWTDLLHLVFYDVFDDETPEQQLADPQHLWNAPSVSAARKAKLAKLKARRGKGKLTGRPGKSAERVLLQQATAITNSGSEDPLEFIKRTAPMSESHIRVKREHTRRTRNHIRARRAGRSPVELTDVNAATEQAAVDTPALTRESAEQLAERLGVPLDLEEDDS